MAAATGTDWYGVLGVESGAGQRAVQQAYRSLALQLHPDRHSTAAASVKAAAGQRMATVTQAYAVLGDAEARAEYDAAVAAARAAAGTAEQGGAAATVDLDDMAWDGTAAVYTSPCRCGGRYALAPADMEGGGSRRAVHCSGCSLLLEVHFVVVSDCDSSGPEDAEG